jgi:hypothetical protein
MPRAMAAIRVRKTQDRDDHGYSDLVRLQPLALPLQKSGERKAPQGGDLGIELAAQVHRHAVVPEHVPNQAAK